MRKLLTFILIIFSAVVYGQGTYISPFNIDNAYGAPGGVVRIGVYVPKDSTFTDSLCVIFNAGGAGQVGNDGYAPSSLGDFIQNGHPSMKFTNPVNGRPYSFLVVYIIKSGTDADGNFNMKYYKSAYDYIVKRSPWKTKINIKRIYFQGLSLSGGAILDLLQDSAVWCNRVAAMSSGSAVGGQFFTGTSTDFTQIKNNLNSTTTHWRGYWALDDGNGGAATARDKARAFYGTPMQLELVTTGNHQGGWTFQDDTTHASYTVDSAFAGAGTNKTYIHNPNKYEWYLQYQSNSTVPNQAPISNAGSNQTTQLPIDTVRLNGSASYDPDGRPLSAYLWTRTSGPNTPTIVNNTSASTKVTGLIAGTYVFNLQVTDDSSATANSTTTVTVLPAAQGQAKAYNFYDFWYSGVDRNQPHKFFDGNVLTEGTPRKMQDYYGFFKVVGNDHVLHPWTKWGQCRGWIDLAGAQQLRDTTLKFRIDSVRGYSTGPSNFKVYFFNGDKFWRPSYHNRWQAIDDPGGNGMVPFDSLTTTSTPGWVKGSMTFPDSMRYVFMIITGDTTTQNLAKFGELQFYGVYKFDTSTVTHRAPMYAGALPTQYTDSTTYGSKRGNNYFNGPGPITQSYWKNGRTFFAAVNGDTALAQAIPTKYKNPLTRFSDINATTLAANKALGGTMYLTNQGGSAYDTLNHNGFVYSDTILTSKSNPNNYKRASDYYKQLALYAGRNTSGTNKFSDNPANGQDLMRYLTTGNENNGHDGFNDLDYFAYTTATYDGNESSIIVDGAPTGIKNGDPSMMVVMPASVEHDTMHIATQFFYAQMLRADGKVPWDVGDMHKYFDVTDSLGGIVPDLTDKVGSHSSSPEMAINSKTGLLKYSDTIARRIFKYFPTTMQWWWSETGRNKYGTVAATPTQAGSFDQSNTPGFGPYDSTKAAAILNYREFILTGHTFWRRRYHYSAANSSGATQAPGRFASMGAYYSYNISTFEFDGRLPDAYINESSQRINNFSGKTVIKDGGYLSDWQLRAQKYGTDSVMETIWYGTTNGTTGTNTYTLSTGYTVSVPVTEVPVHLFYKESNPSAVSMVTPSLTSSSPTTTNLTAFGGGGSAAACPCSQLLIKRY